MKKVFSFIFMICVISISSLYLSSCSKFEPYLEIQAKQIYYIGDQLKEDDVKIKYYKENSENFDELSIYDVYVSGLDTETVGKKQYTIEYDGLTKTVDYEVFELKATKVEKINNIETKYNLGDQKLNKTESFVEVVLRLNNSDIINIALDDVYYTNNNIYQSDNYMVVGEFLTETVGKHFVECEIYINVEYKNILINCDFTYKFYYNVLSPIKSIDTVVGIQTEYIVGDSLMLNNNARIYYTYQDGSTSNVQLTKAMISNFSTETIGKRKMIITYMQKTKTIEYTVIGIKEILFANIATSYFVGDRLAQAENSIMGIYIKYEKTNGSIDYAYQSDFEIENFSTKTAGNFVMKILYKDKIYNLHYIVKAVILTDFTIKTNQLYVGDTIDDLEVNALQCKFNNGDEYFLGEFSKSDFIFNNFNASSSGTHIMKVTYGGVTIDFSYNVLEIEPVKILSVHNVPTKFSQGEVYNFEDSYLIYENNDGSTNRLNIDRVKMVYKETEDGFNGNLTEEIGSFKMVILLIEEVDEYESIIIDKFYVDYIVE